jgi:chlorite dismutase
MAGNPTYTVFWLYKGDPSWRERPESDKARAREAFLSTLESHQDVSLRAAYSTIGFRADVDLILWTIAPSAEALQQLAIDLNRTELGRALEMRYSYLGIGGFSRYDAEHGPAFLKGIPPKRYLSVYPFIKTPQWYVLPFEERRAMMAVHGDLGDEYPSILTNTVSSFGIADQEFIVALEDDDPAVLVQMVQRLREAEVRIYTSVDTPIFLGLRKPAEEALTDLG